MEWEQLKGNWNEYKGKVREYWGKLSDDELEAIAGQKDQLIGKLQQAYGISKEEAEKQAEDFRQHLQ